METINLSKVVSLITAIENCKKSHNTEWEQKHGYLLDEYLKRLPYGSGLDIGVTFDRYQSKPEKLIFVTAYHHMNENGYYDGWTNHKIIITPSFQFGYIITITGPDKNQIKEYLNDLFHSVFVIDPNFNDLNKI